MFRIWKRSATLAVAACVICLLVAVSAPLVAAAGSTDVRVTPAEVTAEPGETVELDIVVGTVDGGVGAWEAEVGLSNGTVADIRDVQLHGDPGLQTVDIAEDNDSVYFDGALANTNNTGTVTIATIRVELTDSGATGIALTVEALGDEAGNSYTVSDTGDGSIVAGESSADGATATAGTDGTKSVNETDTAGDHRGGGATGGASNAAEATASPTVTAVGTATDATATAETGTEGDATDSPSDTERGSATQSPTGASPDGSSDAFAPGFTPLAALLALCLSFVLLVRRRT